MILYGERDKFYRDNSRVACIMGPIGSGKSVAAALRIARHALEQKPGPDGVAYFRAAIVRQTGPQLNQTTKDTWFRLFPSDGVLRKWISTKNTQVWHFQPAGCNYILHAEFLFRALDDDRDIANLLGLEVTCFWFNELREISQKIIANAGPRAGRYPSAEMGGCTWRGWIGDTNPWPFTSDFHKKFVVDKPEDYAFFKQPGGDTPEAENLENLEQTVESRLLSWNDPVRIARGRTYYANALSGYDKAEADMMVRCKYGASRDGEPVYISYDDNTHCKPFELLRTRDHPKQTPYAPLLIGYDNTGRNPAALVAQRTDTGQWLWRYEFVGEGVGMKAHAAGLRRFLSDKVPDHRILKITCDPAGKAKGADDLDMRMIVQQEFPGVPVLNARTNDPSTRIEAVDGAFRRMINGESAVLLHPECKILRDACIGSYKYRKLKVSGSDQYTDTPHKITPWADIADAAQYLMLGGGEGRINVNPLGKDPNWPQNGEAITPKAPERRDNEQRPDPRNGSVFRDNW